MKTCTECNETKTLDEFYPRKDRLGQYRSKCKKCINSQNAKWREGKNEYFAEAQREFKKRNPERVYNTGKKWRTENPKRHHALTIKSRAKNNAPKWLTEHQLMQIQWFYEAAKMMTETTGVLHEVDHIHPLKGKNFNGLHVPWNLQCIPKIENRKKNNKLKNEKHAFV